MNATDHVFRGDALGDCGGCQVMSNPLILHGTQITLPKARAPPNPHPLPCIPEGTATCSQPSDTSTTSLGAHPAPEGAQTGVTGLVSAYQSHRETQPTSHPVRSALSTCAPLGSAAQAARRATAKAALAAKEAEDTKVRTLNADERLKRLKLRMQHTIQAYSGNFSSAGGAGAGRYSRTHSLTAALPHVAYHRTNPVQASRVSGCALAQKALDESSSCHSSSSCSSAASLASMESGVGRAAQEGSREGLSGQKSHEQQLGLPSCVPNQRCINQVQFLCVCPCVCGLFHVLSYVWCENVLESVLMQNPLESRASNLRPKLHPNIKTSRWLVAQR